MVDLLTGLILKKMNKLLLLLFCLMNTYAFSKLIKQEPSEDVFTYIGRFDLSNPKKPQFAHSGNQIEFQFKGNELRVGLSDISNGGPENKNLFNVVINGQIKQVIENSLATKFHKIEVNSPDSFVNVEIFKRTEASCAIAVFHGVKYEIGEFKKSVSKSRRIEWVGDSFLVGYGNLVTVAAPPAGNPSTGFHAANQDGYYGFGAITSRSLHANYSCIGVSGHGVYRNFDTAEEGTLPKVYPFLFPSDGVQQSYHFSYNPDLIVLKIGTNDFGAEMNDPNNLADSTRFVSTYLKFLKYVTEKNPNSKIVLVVGGGITDYFPAGLKRLTRFRSWVETVKLESEKLYLNTFGFFEFKAQTAPYGEDWHPTVKSQQKFASEITPYLKAFMNW